MEDERGSHGSDVGGMDFCKEATIESSVLRRLPAGIRFKSCFLNLLVTSGYFKGSYKIDVGSKTHDFIHL